MQGCGQVLTWIVVIVVLIVGVSLCSNGSRGGSPASESRSYDSLRSGAAATSSRPPQPGNQWSAASWRGELTDFQNHSLRTPVTRLMQDRYGRAIMPVLVIRCMDDTTSLHVEAQEYLGLDELTVTYRVGETQARTRSMSISTGNDAFGIWSGGQSIPLVRQLMTADTFIVRYTPYGEDPRTASFDVSDLEARIGNLREACHW